MHDYDLNVILDPNLNETQVGLEKDAIAAQIERAEGEIVALDEWGNKRLAYPIRKLNEGYYLIYSLKLSEAAPRQLNTNLKLRDNVMRVLITRERPEQRTRKQRESKETQRETQRDVPQRETQNGPRDQAPAASA